MPVPETFYSSVYDKLHTVSLLDTDKPVVRVTEEQPNVVVTNNMQEVIRSGRISRKPMKLNVVQYMYNVSILKTFLIVVSSAPSHLVFDILIFRRNIWHFIKAFR